MMSEQITVLAKRKIRGILNDNIIVMDAFIRSWNHTDTILKVYLTYIFRYCQGFWNFLCGILVHIVRIHGIFYVECFDVRMFDVILNGNSTYNICMLSKSNLKDAWCFLYGILVCI